LQDGADDPSLIVELPHQIGNVPGGYSLLATFADKSTVACNLAIAKPGS
jgi:hypothetical protein